MRLCERCMYAYVHRNGANVYIHRNGAKVTECNFGHSLDEVVKYRLPNPTAVSALGIFWSSATPHCLNVRTSVRVLK